VADRKLRFRAEARESLLRGTRALADAVRITSGPRSKSALIQNSFGPPIVCDDGVTIAREFRLKDHPQDMGAQLLRQAAERTGESVGDGTLGAPARQIAENSAMDGGAVLAEMKKGAGTHGFDPARNIYTDLIEAGIIDPTKVVRIALENAVSVAASPLLTEATMAEVKEDEDKAEREALEPYV
jgi:chaperonin GroEL (HSP60 family)